MYFSQLNGYYSFNFHSAAHFSSDYQTVKGGLSPAAGSSMAQREINDIMEKLLL